MTLFSQTDDVNVEDTLTKCIQFEQQRVTMLRTLNPSEGHNLIASRECFGISKLMKFVRSRKMENI